jgi:hypothetical protein
MFWGSAGEMVTPAGSELAFKETVPVKPFSGARVI